VSWTGSDAGVGIGRYELQRSTDGGSYRAVGLSGATVTHANVSFEFGRSYRFRVRAVDRNGNVSAWKYGPTFSTGRSQETSGYITYAGAWSRVRNTNDSAKHARTTQTAGRSATYTRSIRDVALVAPKSSSRGSVRIFVDGNLVATVSLKASSKHFRQVLWSTHFASPASHAIRVVVVGNGRVDIDCFVALV
jgi:hypothetical protein